MKYLKLFILLMLPLVGFAQNDNPTKQHKFGVGLGYNFNSVMGDSIRPLEVSFRYKLNDKHTFQLYSPIRLKQTKQFPESKFKDSKNTQHLYGVGFMYDYAFNFKNDLAAFIGLGIDYQRMKFDDFKNYPSYNYSKELEWIIDYKAYSVYPYVGLRYMINNLGVEAYYKPIFSLLKMKEDVYYDLYDYETGERRGGGSTDVPLKETMSLQSVLSVKLFYYF